MKSYTDKQVKPLGESKHYSPANKEWPNSSYNFNKNHLRHTPFKDNLGNKLVKGFFNLHKEKNLARSRRMRSLRIKNSSKRLFAGKPEIKQTSDKAIITLYTFNRQKQFFLRKIYLLKRKLYSQL